MKTRNAYYFLISGFLLAVGFNLPHMVEAYRIASPLEDMPVWVLWCTLIVMELGILILALNKNIDSAKVFAWLIFLLNLYVYWSPLEFVNRLSFWVSLVPGLLFAAVPAFFIYYFSEKIAELVEYRNEIQAYKDRAEKAEADFAGKMEEIQAISAELSGIKEAYDEMLGDYDVMKEERDKWAKKLRALESRDGKAGMLANVLSREWEYTKKSKDNLRKQIVARKEKLNKNGISGEEKEKLQAEIIAMEAARNRN